MAIKRRFAYIQFSFLLGLALTIVPFSGSFGSLNPQWLVLVVAYWGIYLPERAGIITAWFWGLFLDVALGTHMGLHALSLALVSYMTVILYLRLRMYPLWQQMFFIWLLAGLDKLVTFQLMNVFMPMEVDWHYWMSTLTTALIWPLILVMFKWYRHKRQF
ncbi:MAG TPA: rod shape-determining protein MreD [Aeromonadales bacterium]|nr:rod shape-determining protein MreD [Aeromonadales bacterium]